MSNYVKEQIYELAKKVTNWCDPEGLRMLHKSLNPKDLPLFFPRGVYTLIKKGFLVHKHLEAQDKDANFCLIWIESSIYYKTKWVLPLKYESFTASGILA